MDLKRIGLILRYFRENRLEMKQAEFGRLLYGDKDATDNALQQRVKVLESGHRKKLTQPEFDGFLGALGVSEEEFFSIDIKAVGESVVEDGDPGVLNISIPKSFVGAHPEIVDSLHLLGEAERMGKSPALKDAIIADLVECLRKKHPHIDDE